MVRQQGKGHAQPQTGVRQFWLSGLKSWGIGTFLAAAFATPGLAAEQVELTLKPFGKFMIPVADLDSFAQKGEVSKQFQFFAKVAPDKQLEELREILQQRYEVSPTTIEQFTATQVGQDLLKQLTYVIQPSSSKNASEALRKAFITAASDRQGFTIVNFLRAFPGQAVQVDIKQSFAVVRELQALFQTRDQVSAKIKEQAAQEGSTAVVLPKPIDNLQQAGSFTWQKQGYTIEHPKRRLSFPVDLYLPEKVEAAPVVVISHGLASDLNTFVYLAEHLASRGYAVAVIEHPGTNATEIERFFAGLNQFRGPEDWLNRPLDVTYLLDSLEKKAEAEPEWGKRINLKQVGMVGQSFGGYTALALGGAELNLNALRQACPQPSNKAISFNISLLFQCEALLLPTQSYRLQDQRIKAILALNTIGADIFSQKGMSQVKVPVMFIAGGDDVFAPTTAEQVIPFTWLTTPNKYLVLMDKGTHFSFLAGTEKGGVLPVPPELVGPDPNLAQPVLKTLSTAFFESYLKDQTQYQAYLSQSYLQKISRAPFQLSVIKSLNADVLEPILSKPANSFDLLGKRKSQK
jgi:predicted dienelactone hydrolase